MILNVRPYQVEEDYWRMRAFLRDVFLLNGRLERAWQAYRLDYWIGHGVKNLGHGSLESHVYLWETPDGRPGAILNGEGPGNAFLQIHPDFEDPVLVDEMVSIAEQHLCRKTDTGTHLNVWVNENQAMRKDVLRRRGYRRGNWTEFQRRRDMSVQVPDIATTPGYIVRALGDIDELPSRSWASWKSFHPYDPDDDYDGWEWYLNIQRCPLYRRDLDIVAIAPDGEVASFCTVWFDDVTRTGAFEPVGTHVDHWRKGLGKAVMAEGLRRLRSLGATLAFVGSSEEPAHRLYESMGFTAFEASEQWEREGG